MRCLTNKHEKKLLDTDTKIGLVAAKTASKKVVYKTVEATGTLIGNKLAKSIAQPKSISRANSRNVDVVVILSEKRQEILNKLRLVLLNGTSKNIKKLKRFNCIKVCDKKMDRSK